MADDEPQQQSIHARIAALNMHHVGRAPVTAQPAQPPQAGTRPTPQPPIKRVQSSTVPVVGSQSQEIGNQPNNYVNGRNVLAPPEITRTGQKSPGTNGATAPKPAASKYSPRLPARTNTNDAPAKPAPPPRLPARTDTSSSMNTPPTVPARRPSDMSRRDSQESVASTMSSMSALSTTSGRTPSMDGGRVRAPVYDPSTLPPLPPKRTQEDKDKAYTQLPPKVSRTPTIVKSATSSISSKTSSIANRVRPGSSQPSLPRRPTAQASPDESLPSPPPRRLPPTDVPQLPARPESTPARDPVLRPRSNGLPTPESTPPPIPTSTRPDISKLLATKPKLPSAGSTSAAQCLLCRDFSAPDTHAAKFPRQSVPSIDWLAAQLTQPFPSATDKARAIFTWLHHNVHYNVEAFFNNNVKPSTPASTLSTGLAVCEGYAALFSALATKAGLACVVVGGHGKGYGYDALQPGQPCPPPDPSGHAWNAVQIDGGQWKLLDPCWGAGNVKGAGQPYNPDFTPAEFTKSNEDFGRTHYPQNPAHFYRADRRHPSWEEYIRGDVPGGGEPVQVFSDVAPREGFSKYSFVPKQRQLSAYGSQGSIRFQFERVCPHWDPYRNGPGAPYAYILALACPPDGDESRKPDYVALDDNGRFWWVDVEPSRLGRPGDHLTLFAVTSVNGEDARGLGKAGWEAAWGRKGMGFAGVATWDVV